MMRAFMLLLLFGFGCTADGDKGSWEEVMKDIRGENMELRDDFSGTARMEGRDGRLNSRK